MSRLLKSEPFTQVPNRAIRDKRLNLATIGMWAFLWNLPNKWEFSVSGLAKAKGCGICAATNAVKALEQYGYLRRVQCREGSKFSGYDYVLIPNPKQSDTAENPLAGKLYNGEHSNGKSIKWKNEDNIISNNEINKNIINIGASNVDCGIDQELIDMIGKENLLL